MGDCHRVHEVLLEPRLHRRLDLLDPPHLALELPAKPPVEEGDARPGARRVARRRDPRRLAVGDHAEDEGVLRVDLAPERAREGDPVHRVDPHPVHEEARARVERRLGELDLAHVVLGDRNLGLAGPDDVGPGAPAPYDARRAFGESPVDGAVRVDDAGEEELGDRLHDP